MLLIIFIIPFALWFCFMLAVRPKWEARLPKNGWGTLADLALCAVFMLIPVADEVVGGIQFWNLCRSEPPLKIDAARAAGRVAKVSFEPVKAPEIVKGMAIPIEMSKTIYRDTKTDEVITSFRNFRIPKGGLLIRTLGISESDSPILLQTTSCGPGIGFSVSDRYKFTLIRSRR
jgi:hypothetical protein